MTDRKTCVYTVAPAGERIRFLAPLCCGRGMRAFIPGFSNAGFLTIEPTQNLLLGLTKASASRGLNHKHITGVHLNFGSAVEEFSFTIVALHRVLTQCAGFSAI